MRNARETGSGGELGTRSSGVGVRRRPKAATRAREPPLLAGRQTRTEPVNSSDRTKDGRTYMLDGATSATKYLGLPTTTSALNSYLHLGVVMPPPKQLLSQPLLGQHLLAKGVPVRPFQPGHCTLGDGPGFFDQTALEATRPSVCTEQQHRGTTFTRVYIWTHFVGSRPLSRFRALQGSAPLVPPSVVERKLSK